jgi:kynurenine formamidase
VACTVPHRQPKEANMSPTFEPVLENSQQTKTRSRRSRTTVFAAVAGLATFAASGAVAVGVGVSFKGGDGGKASLECPRGMARLGHVFSVNASVFPGDPVPEIKVVANIPDDGFQVEEVKTGVHTGTHIDAPGHFIEGARTIDDLAAKEFVWPAYVIDVRARMAATAEDGFQLTVDDIRAYERENGKIAKGSMVIIRTGFDQFYGTPAFLGDTPGFSGDAVNWLVANRQIGGVGSDTFGPDATSDADYSATYNILAADKVALPGLNNLAELQVKGDLIMAPAVALKDGSGYQTDPLACLGQQQRNDNDD